jgi:hypothetical protein
MAHIAFVCRGGGVIHHSNTVWQHTVQVVWRCAIAHGMALVRKAIAAECYLIFVACTGGETDTIELSICNQRHANHPAIGDA